jgi:hypothetical protein
MSDTELIYSEEFTSPNWPTDGPHDPIRLLNAWNVIAELIRYSNHASYSKDALASAPETSNTTGAYQEAMYRLVQFTQALADWAGNLAADPTLRHDGRRGKADSQRAASVAALNASMILSQGVSAAKTLADLAGAAHQEISHLYHEQGEG